MENNKASCPVCKSNSDVVGILYGRPGPQAIKDANEGKIVLRGCSPKPENWYCKKCKKDFV